MSDDTIRDSFRRCEASGDFADRFYSIFLKMSPEIENLFANTDFAKQNKLLRGSVFMLVTCEVTDEKTRQAMERIGESHNRHNLDIQPEWYEVWLDAVCETVSELDPLWSDELEEEWRRRMRPGIDLITSFY